MPRRFALGLDLGGSGPRCLLLDVASGATLVEARGWASFGGPGVDLDLDACFARVAETVRATLARAGAGAEVAGVAVTAVRFGCIVVDRAGSPVLAASNRDSRAAAEGLALAAGQGAELQRRTGHWPLAIGAAALLRARARRGELGEGETLLALNDWVAYRLTGERATDFSQAGVTGLWNVADADWDAVALAAVGASRALMPPVRPAGSRLGALRADVAAAFGLRAGTPVAVGGGDTQCALLGLGVLDAGCSAAVCGTTLPLQRVVAEPRLDDAGALWLEPHLAPGRFVLESNAGSSGDALDWLGRTLFGERRSGTARLFAEAAEVAPGASGILSSFGAQRFDARAMVLPTGDFALSYLSVPPEDGRGAFARAALEGVAFGVRENLAQLRATAGADAVPLRVGGGMTRSPVFAALLADVLGEPVEAGAIEASALGAALCAGVGAGVWPDLASAAASLPAPVLCQPQPEMAARYAELHPRWAEWLAGRSASQPLAQGHALRALAARRGPSASAASAPRPRILVAADLDEDALALLRSLGAVTDASYRKVGRLLAGEKLVEALRGVEVFVTEIDLVDATSLLALPELRVVAACRGDAVNVDAEACARLGIPVLHAPGRNADAVADLTLAFLLALARKLPEAFTFLRDPARNAGDLASMGRAYGTLRGRELWRKTIGLVGFGAVARKVAERLLPFGAELLAFDPWQPAERVRRGGAEPVSLDELLARSDFVSLHAAVTDASRGLIGAAQLARMKQGACLVNTARAALVDEDALAAALASGHLAGAGLDVFGVEPTPPDHPLLASPGVIATPHIGGNTAEIGAHQGRIVGEDLARLLAGEAPRHVVRREALASFRWTGARAEPDAATRAWLLARPAPSLTDLQRDKGKAPVKK